MAALQIGHLALLVLHIGVHEAIGEPASYDRAGSKAFQRGFKGLGKPDTVGQEAVMNHQSAYSFQTVDGNPVCAAAAGAVLETIEEDGLVENAKRTGAYLPEGLNSLKKRHGLVGDVRGRGLAIGVELVSDRGTKAPASRETAMTVYRCFELGLVLFYVGVNSNVLEFTPPLTLTRERSEERRVGQACR